MESSVAQQFLPRPDAFARAEIERRQYIRFPSNVPAVLVDQEHRATIEGIARNIAVGGCYVEAERTFPAGARVLLDLKFERHVFQCEARITHVLTCSGVGMGVAFSRYYLLEWIAHMDAIFEAGAAIRER